MNVFSFYCIGKYSIEILFLVSIIFRPYWNRFYWWYSTNIVRYIGIFVKWQWMASICLNEYFTNWLPLGYLNGNNLTSDLAVKIFHESGFTNNNSAQEDFSLNWFQIRIKFLEALRHLVVRSVEVLSSNEEVNKWRDYIVRFISATQISEISSEMTFTFYSNIIFSYHKNHSL